MMIASDVPASQLLEDWQEQSDRARFYLGPLGSGIEILSVEGDGERVSVRVEGARLRYFPHGRIDYVARPR